jgi:hypothetical protein
MTIGQNKRGGSPRLDIGYLRELERRVSHLEGLGQHTIRKGTFIRKTHADAEQAGDVLTLGDSSYYTAAELDAGALDTRYYTETELLGGVLDSRYYTETELDGGVLDDRYYTVAEVDALIADVAIDDLSDVTITTPADNEILGYDSTLGKWINQTLAELGFINTSAGAADAGKGIVLDADGHVDATMINNADIDHGSSGGLGDDDHSQYPLLAGRDGDILNIDGLKAYDGAGLSLFDDGGAGIFIQDESLGGLNNDVVYVGINTGAPGGLFHIYNEKVVTDPHFYLENVGAASGALYCKFEADHIVNLEAYCHSDTATRLARFRFMKSRGTQASPTIVVNGDSIGGFNFFGYDGDEYLNIASITAKVDGVAADDDVPSLIEFSTFEKGGSKTTRLTIDNTGNILIHEATAGTNSVGAIALHNAGTVPASSPADEIQLYAEDVVGSSELKVRDEGSNITTLSPHNFTLFTPNPSYVYPWSYYAKNPVIGKEINVDMYGVVAAVEALTGKQFIYTHDLPQEEHKTWDELQAINSTQHDRKEWLRVKDEIGDLLEKEVEINKDEAIGLVEETKRVKGEAEKIKAIDKKTGEIVEIEKPTTIYVGTGKYIYAPKPGVRFDKKTGKFYRNITEEEAMELVPPISAYNIKKIPAWMGVLIKDKM